MRCHALIRTILVVFGIACAASAPVAASPTLDKIKATGMMTFGYRNGAPPFSFKDAEGRIRGYSVELCTRIAAAIQKELSIAELKLDWQSMEASTRLEAVASGKVDIDCGTTTMSLSRMKIVDFSLPIFVDGGGILVHTKPKAKSKLFKIADLKGKRIAVISDTTTEQALVSALRARAMSAELVKVTNGREGMALLNEGKVDGYAGDRVVLANLKLHAPYPDTLTFVTEDFSYEPYGLALRRDDPDFRLAVNRALVNIYRSGEIDEIFQRWLGPLGKPGTLLHAMFYLSTLPE